MTEINKITGVVVGQYGEAIPLVVCDKDGVAVDISSYTTSKTVTIRSPYTLNTKTYTATFVTDGTNGQIQFTPAAGDIDREGTWEGQIKLEGATSIRKTSIFDMQVEKSVVPSS